MTTTTRQRHDHDDRVTTRSWRLELSVALIGVIVGLAAVAFFLN